MKKICITLLLFITFMSNAFGFQINNIIIKGNNYISENQIRTSISDILNTANSYTDASLAHSLSLVKERLESSGIFSSVITTANNSSVTIDVMENSSTSTRFAPVYIDYNVTDSQGVKTQYLFGLNAQFVGIKNSISDGILYSLGIGNKPAEYRYYDSENSKIISSKLQEIGINGNIGIQLKNNTQLFFLNSYTVLTDRDYNKLISYYMSGFSIHIDKSEINTNGYILDGAYNHMFSDTLNLDRVTFESKIYHPITTKFTLTNRTKYGWQNSNNQSVPLSIQFSASGLNGIRGLYFNNVNGNNMLLSTTELTSSIINTKVVPFVFVDCGKIGNSNLFTDNAPVLCSYGGGLRAAIGSATLQTYAAWDNASHFSVEFGSVVPF